MASRTVIVPVNAVCVNHQVIFMDHVMTDTDHSWTVRTFDTCIEQFTGPTKSFSRVSLALTEYENRIRSYTAATPSIWNTKRCALCGSPMVKREGRFGTFYACSTWSDTGCQCTTDAQGHLSKKTEGIIKEREKAKFETDDSLESRLDNLDLS